jgi:hypothetical protein
MTILRPKGFEKVNKKIALPLPTIPWKALNPSPQQQHRKSRGMSLKPGMGLIWSFFTEFLVPATIG